MSTKGKSAEKGFGEQLIEAVEEMAAHQRGEIELETYEIPDHILTPDRTQALRRKVASSTKEFERLFGVNTHTMERYEAGRHAPDAGTAFLLHMIDKEPEAVKRVLDELAASRAAHYGADDIEQRDEKASTPVSTPRKRSSPKRPAARRSGRRTSAHAA